MISLVTLEAAHHVSQKFRLPAGVAEPKLRQSATREPKNLQSACGSVVRPSIVEDMNVGNTVVRGRAGLRLGKQLGESLGRSQFLLKGLMNSKLSISALESVVGPSNAARTLVQSSAIKVHATPVERPYSRISAATAVELSSNRHYLVEQGRHPVDMIASGQKSVVIHRFLTIAIWTTNSVQNARF